MESGRIMNCGTCKHRGEAIAVCDTAHHPKKVRRFAPCKAPMPPTLITQEEYLYVPETYECLLWQPKEK